MGKLDPDGVVNDDEYKQQRVRHEVLLTIVSKRFVIFAQLLSDLYGLDVNGFVADERETKPHSDPGTESHELIEKRQVQDFFCLSGLRIVLRTYDSDHSITRKQKI